jgi:archaellum component FlaC
MEDEMKSDEKKLIWVPDELATEFENATGESAQIEVVKKIIAKAKGSMEDDLNALGEDAARFRGIMLGYKKEYGKVLEEHLTATYKVWEDIEDKMPNTKGICAKLSSEVKTIETEIDHVLEKVKSIETKLNGFSTYQLMEIVKVISGADEKTCDILRLALIKKDEK